MEQPDIRWYDQHLLRRAGNLRLRVEQTMRFIEIPELREPWMAIRDALAARGISARNRLDEERLVWSLVSRLSGRFRVRGPAREVRVDDELLDRVLAFGSAVLRFERPSWRMEPARCPVCNVERRVPRLLKLEWLRQHMGEHQQRVAGVLVGLAAGDENGGPTEMALRLAESLLEFNRYDPDDVFDRYLEWHRQGSYDTGPVTGRVLDHALVGMPRIRAVAQVNRELRGMTAGCNAAHRAGVLAMAPWLDIDSLVVAAREEARLTHYHPIAVDAAVAVAVRCRDEIMGRARFAPRQLPEVAEGLRPEVRKALKAPRPPSARLLDPAFPARSYLHDGGYSPGTLHAALAFTSTAREPIEALAASKAFAGPANYCPVLVGAFLGARFGASVFDDDQLRHHTSEHIARIRRTADGLAELWRADRGAGLDH